MVIHDSYGAVQSVGLKRRRLLTVTQLTGAHAFSMTLCRHGSYDESRLGIVLCYPPKGRNDLGSSSPKQPYTRYSVFLI